MWAEVYPEKLPMHLRRLISAFFLLILNTNLFSQSKISLGVKAAVNGDLAGVFKRGYSLKETNNYAGGELLFSVNQKVSKVFSIQGESGFRYKHYYLSSIASYHFGSTELQGQFGFLSYDFLILPQFETKKKVRFIFNTGPMFGCVVLAHGNGLYRKTWTTMYPSWTYKSETTTYNDIIKSGVKRFSFGYVVGAGLKVLSKKNYYYTLEGRYVFDPMNHFAVEYFRFRHILSLHLGIHFNMPEKKRK